MKGNLSKAYSFDLKPLLHTERMPYFSPERASWSIVEGSLPAGLTLTSDGVITGTAAEPGLFDVRIKASYKRMSGEIAYELLSLKFSLHKTGATSV